MRYAQDHKQRVRETLLHTGARLVREKGAAKLSVATLMTRAKMTVGGFYRHFDSQEAMVGESLAEAMRESVTRLTEGLEHEQGASFEQALVQRYLSTWHYTHAAQGCPLAATGSDLARLPVHAREPLLREAMALVDHLASKLGSSRAARGRALLVLAACAGGMSIARAVGGAKGRETMDLICEALSTEALS